MSLFSLPPEFTCSREPIPGGVLLRFHHIALGEVGRLVFRQQAGGIHITTEVAGEPDDPGTARRQAVFVPLAEQVVRQLETAMGKGPSQPAPVIHPAPAEEHTVMVKEMTCALCDEVVALLVFAEEANNPARFEDLARLLYPRCQAMQVPTWIVGEPLSEPGFDTPAYTMKIWPAREPLKRLSPNELNPVVDALVEGHCQRV